MDLSPIAGAFERDGFAVARSVFNAGEISRLAAELDRFMRNVAPSLSGVDVNTDGSTPPHITSMHRLEAHLPAFEALRRDERLVGLARAALNDDDVEPRFVSYFNKLPHSDAVTPVHQDNAFQNWSPAIALELTVAIDPSDAANGALRCQRATHRMGDLRHRPSGVKGFSRTLIERLDEKLHPWVDLAMSSGDVALHHVLTVHASGSNHTGQSRRQVGISYRGSKAQVDVAAREQYQRDLAALHAPAKPAN